MCRCLLRKRIRRWWSGAQGGAADPPRRFSRCRSPHDLDRLGPARGGAQIGAAGRDFVYGLLRDVAGNGRAGATSIIDRLADADLLFVEGAPPGANYRFKHALIQDAVRAIPAQEPPSGAAPPRGRSAGRSQGPV